MREIKFRAWDGGRMYYFDDDMMYGQFFLEFSDIAGWNVISPHSKNYVCGTSSDKAETSILMQFTGLKDKNNIDIYEGDILNGVADTPVTVGWNNHYASFVLDKKGWMYSHWFGESCNPENTEIIGNIYETKPQTIKQ